MVRISELVRVYLVLQNTDQGADRFTRMAYMRTRTGSEMTGWGCAEVAVGLL